MRGVAERRFPHAGSRLLADHGTLRKHACATRPGFLLAISNGLAGVVIRELPPV
jgi:hypothetical protein